MRADVAVVPVAAAVPVGVTTSAVSSVQRFGPIDDPAERTRIVRVESTTIPRLLNVDELAAALQVSRGSIYRWSKAGRIPFVAAGRNKRFILDEVVAALRDDRRARPEQAPPIAAAAPRRAPTPRPALAAAPPRREPPGNEAERIAAVVAATSRLGERR